MLRKVGPGPVQAEAVMGVAATERLGSLGSAESLPGEQPDHLALALAEAGESFDQRQAFL